MTAFGLEGLRPDVAKAVELILRIVGGDFGARGEVTGSGDDLDAVIVALNMMAESFQVERSGRERAEALLADAVDAYEHAPDLFCSCEPEGLTVIKCNQTMADTLGLETQGVLGRHVLDLVEAPSRAGLRRALESLITTGAMPIAEVTLSRAGGPTAVVSVAGSLKRAPDGSPERLRLVMRDVTTERRLEEQLVHAQRMEAIGRLAGGVAHDFNNLLMVIQTAASLLEARAKGRTNELRDIALILEASERGATLTRDLLAFSRRQPVRKEVVRIDDVIREGAAMFSRLLGEGSTLQLELGAHDASVELDPGRFVQALVNLIVNARDAMPGGGVLTIRTGRVEASVAKTELLRGPHVEVRVSDSGGGIDPEVIPRIFDPFFTTKPVGKGTGLGLSMVYGTVRQAGGVITVASERGVGSTFRLLLPCAEATPRERSQRAPEPTEAPVILLVEDDGPVRAVTSRILTGAGYQVVEAASGQIALELGNRPGARFDLVLSDVVMPGISGLDTVNQLRLRHPDLPCVFMTGFSVERSGALEAVSHGVLDKPFVPASLLAIVSAALSAGPRPGT
jgi:two-component system cell cycle sensor histidine kinase/response regulator CckA